MNSLVKNTFMKCKLTKEISNEKEIRIDMKDSKACVMHEHSPEGDVEERSDDILINTDDSVID